MEEHLTDREFLDSVQGEIAFFRGVSQARPVGMNRHFHMLAIQQHIKEATKREIDIDALWGKLRSLYDLEKLENMDLSEEDESPPKMDLPLPDNAEFVNLATPTIRKIIFHPHFREEYSLPPGEYESIAAQRRLKDTPSSADESTTRPSRRHLRSKDRNAGLVSGDSESSDLTEGDGDQEGRAEDDQGDRPLPPRRGRPPAKARKGAQSVTKTRGAPKIETMKRRKPQK